MIALITGATSGLGYEFAKQLSQVGYDLILTSRNASELRRISNEFNTKVYTVALDLSLSSNCFKLYEYAKKYNIDLLINCAGFGLLGQFSDTSISTELNMIDLNIKKYHILTKLFLCDMIKNNKGTILNVSSSAAFQPGPLFSTYYATKSYVYSLTMAIYEELRRHDSKVHLHVLCPGPISTRFNIRAGVSNDLKSMSSKEVVKYTLKCMNKNKLLIIPGVRIKFGVFLTRFVSRKTLLKIMYNIQNKKNTH